ncbi:substrate-binding domain-containing protein [Nonomuraea sp. NPDC048826]|uniref:substrate-binding domain-containing protein n=1 Tax=Nonomuraea sp. NPDC048826 TaxID=3364347 RepID=UPI00371FCE87
MTPDHPRPPLPQPVIAGGPIASVLTGGPTRDRGLVADLAERRGSRKPRRNALVDVVMQGPVSPYALAILGGVEDAAWRLGVDLVLSAAGDRAGHGWLDRVGGHDTAGVLLLRTSPTADAWAWLAGRGIPAVFVDPRRKPPPEVPVVVSANRAGAKAAVAHLIGLGHERVAVITGRPGVPCGVDRLAGYRDAMAEAGLPTWSACGYFQTGLARRATLDLLNRLPEPPTAIFACSDAMAVGVYEALAERGLSIPGDVSVVGFDDAPVAAGVTPALTTVRQPWPDLGATALTTLLSGGSPALVELPTTLLTRSSTAGAAPRI